MMVISLTICILFATVLEYYYYNGKLSTKEEEDDDDQEYDELDLNYIPLLDHHCNDECEEV